MLDSIYDSSEHVHGDDQRCQTPAVKEGLIHNDLNGGGQSQGCESNVTYKKERALLTSRTYIQTIKELKLTFESPYSYGFDSPKQYVHVFIDYYLDFIRVMCR
jgi:hypothetical protein